MSKSRPATGDLGRPTTPQFDVVPNDREHLSRRLRLSLVRHCNLSCFFCHNEGQGPVVNRPTEAPTVAEYVRIVSSAVRAGIREIKLTGGEPLLYRDRDGHDIFDLVRELRNLDVDHFGLSMTTNGVRLNRDALQLAESGLDRVTVSLHTLDPKKFHSLITVPGGRTHPASVARGIRRAVEVGLQPVKINTVLFESARTHVGNIDEIPDIFEFCREAGAAQLRLYTLLRHDDFSSHDEWYRYWDRELLSTVGAALLIDEGGDQVDSFVAAAEAFLTSTRSQVYPRPRFIASAGDLEVCIEAMEAGQFDEVGLPDEGPYALRVGSDGELRGLLSAGTCGPNVLTAVRAGTSDKAIERIFLEAISSALPAGTQLCRAKHELQSPATADVP